MRSCEGRTALVAVAAALFVAVIVPLQTYLGNRADYAFGFGRLLAECTMLALIVGAAAYPLLWLSERYLRGALSAAVTAFLVCLYLETGILSAGLPELNGGPLTAFENLNRGLVDLAVLVFVVLGLTVPFRFLRGIYPWIALAVLVLGAASLFDVRKGVVEGPASGSGYHSLPAVLDAVKYSKERNVLVFVLDSMPSTLARELLKEDAELAGAFSGFVSYDNVGMEDRTSRGLPALMTGRYFEADSLPRATEVSVYGPDSMLRPYVESGAAVYSIAVMLPYGYANRACADTGNERARAVCGSSLALRTPSSEVPYLNVADVSVFRALPFLAKAAFAYPRVTRNALTGDGDEVAYHHEHVMFPKLGAADFLDGDGTMLGVFHSWGAHFPVYFDAEGKPLARPSMEFSAIRTEAKNALRRLARLMEDYRRRGIYDKSLIVVAADHGCALMPHAPDRDPRESAILMVKPEGGRGELEFSGIPTSNCRISQLVKDACAVRLDRRAVDGIVRCDRRRFQALVGRGVFREWTIGPHGEALSVRDWKNPAAGR